MTTSQFRNPLTAVLLTIATGSLLYGQSSNQLPNQGKSGPLQQTEQVSGLILRLGSAQRVERIQAERQLLELGPVVLDELPADALLESPAVRDAVRRIRNQLERRSAAANLQASIFDFSDAETLEQTIAAITLQTGNPIDTSQLSADTLRQPVQGREASLTFWRTMGILERIGQLRAEFNERGVLQILPGTRPVLATDADSAIRLRVVKLSPRKRPQARQQSKLRLGLRIEAEPRLRPLFLKLTGSSLELKPSSVEARSFPPLPSLLPPAAQLEFPMGFNRPSTVVEQDFLLGESQTDGMFDLSGQLQLIIAAGVRRFSFSHTGSEKSSIQRRGGVGVRLVSWDLSKGIHTITVRISHDAGGAAFESHRTWILFNAVWLELDDGRIVSSSGPPELVNQSGGNLEIRYRFDSESLADRSATDRSGTVRARFIYEAPTLITTHAIKIGFKGLKPQADQPIRVP